MVGQHDLAARPFRAPPTSPTGVIVWCGARNGRVFARPPSRSPTILWMRVTSIASARLSPAGSTGAAVRASSCPSRRAAQQALWPPAAATISARTAWCWPRTSLRSGSCPVRIRSCRLGASGMGSASARTAFKHADGAAAAFARRAISALHQHRLSRALGGEHERLQIASARRLCYRQRALTAGLTCRRAPARPNKRGPSRRSWAAGRSRPARRTPAPDPTRARPSGRRPARGGRDPARELVPRVADRRPHPLAGLAHRRVGEADDPNAGSPGRMSTSTVTWLGLQALDRECCCSCQHCLLPSVIAEPPKLEIAWDAIRDRGIPSQARLPFRRVIFRPRGRQFDDLRSDKVPRQALSGRPNTAVHDVQVGAA